MLLRLLCLVIYVAGFFALRVYLRKHPPLFTGKFVSPYVQLIYALVWMWGSLLWFVPGLIWERMLPLSAAGMTSVVLPWEAESSQKILPCTGLEPIYALFRHTRSLMNLN